MYQKIAPAGYQINADGKLQHQAQKAHFTPQGWGYSESGYMLRGDLGTKIHTQLGEIVPLVAGATGKVRTISSKHVNLRAEPCTQNCPIVGKIQAQPIATQGAIIRKLHWPNSNKLNWYEVKISTTDGIKQGYVRSDVFEVEGEFTGQLSDGNQTLEFREKYDQFCDADTQACAETDGTTQTPFDSKKRASNNKNAHQTGSVLYAYDDGDSGGQLTSVKPNLIQWLIVGVVGAGALGFLGGHATKGRK